MAPAGQRCKFMSNFAADSEAVAEQNFRTEILARTSNKPSTGRAGTRRQEAARVQIYVCNGKRDKGKKSEKEREREREGRGGKCEKRVSIE